MSGSFVGCRMLRHRTILMFVGCLVIPVTAGAQQLSLARLGTHGPAQIRVTPNPADLPLSRDSHHNPLVVTLASALLPGSGQLLMGQRRGGAYLVLEAAGLGFYVSHLRDGRRQRDRYRSISRTVARAAYSPDGPRGDWDYYERMEKFVASGAFDIVAGGDVQPETDPETYNGSVWLLARQTYWRDPEMPPVPASSEYTAALRFYSERAVSPDMRWSWVGSPEDFSRFREAIGNSNSAFRNAAHSASIVLANHFLSAVDAYVSARVRVRRNEDGSLAISGNIPVRY